MQKSHKMLAALSLGAVLSAGGVGASMLPAGAQPTVTGGLVNVTVTDVVSHNKVNVQVPVNVAAEVCGVSANVLSSATATSPVNCSSATLQQLQAAL